MNLNDYEEAFKGQNTTFDELPSKYDVSDISFTLLNASLKNETGMEINQDKDYLSLELTTKDKKVTNAGLLLSDQGLLVQSRIFCTRWKGLVKGSTYVDALDDKEYTGSIISLLENAETFIKNHSRVGWRIQGMKRIEVEDYPVRAIREAIVNAIIHNLSEASDNLFYEKKKIMRSWTKKSFFYVLFLQFYFS